MWSPRIQKAIDVAAKAHKDQKRKVSDLPYIVHPVGVAAILGACGADEDTVIAGYLHDILEDVPENFSDDDIAREFGEHVLGIVREVSEEKERAGKALLWKERKQTYLEHLPQASHEALMVSAADMCNNMTAMHTEFAQDAEQAGAEFTSTAPERLWFYGERFKLLQERLGDNKIITDYLTPAWQTAQKDLNN